MMEGVHTMNEQQRKEQTQIREGSSMDKKSSSDKPLSEKTSADFAHYFETTFVPPNINKAHKRGRDDVEVFYDFEIPEHLRSIGKGKKFLIQIGRASCRERV